MNNINPAKQVKLDLKDQKILAELSRNSRQSYSDIGKAVKIPKSVVGFRVKKLIDSGVIDLFCTIINKFSLGYRYVRFFIKFRNFNEKIERELVHFLSRRKNINFVATLHGCYDFYIASLIKDIKEFTEISSNIMYTFHKHILEKDLSITHHVHNFPIPYLLKVKEHPSHLYKSFQPDEKDYAIINFIKENSRIPLLELSKKVRLTSQRVRQRIKNLVKENVIMSFRIRLNHNILDYHHFHTFLTLANISEPQEKDIISFLSSLPSTLKITKTVGRYDLEFESTLKSNFELHEIIQQLRNQFPQQIQKVEHALVYKIHPINTMRYGG